MSRPAHQTLIEATVIVEDTMRPQRVPVRAYEAPEALVVIAPMPCVQPGDVWVELHAGRLRFWSHLRSAAPRDYLIDEWDFGGFEREIDLPEGYGRNVEASLANGQLAIRVLRGDFIEVRKVRPVGI